MVKTLSNSYDVLKVRNQDQTLVIFFLSPECPLCQNYALTIKQLQNKFGSTKTRFIAIFSGNNYSAETIKFFLHKYKLKSLEVYTDKEYTLAHKLKASITPEVFVIDKNSRIVYKGRIDNWAYSLAHKRQVITVNDLHDVLQNISNNKSIIYKETKAVGCFIE